jgi:methylated-DNA-[protein]-cysteine S-methyltransferase
MGLAASAAGVHAIVLPRPSRRAVEVELARSCHRDHPVGRTRRDQRNGEAAEILHDARIQLVEYLGAERRTLSVPVDFSSGTPFQRRVWQTISRIPYGRVRSYQWVASRVGGRQYARAVGNALGDNPLPIVVPCHRIVTSTCALGGFSGGLRTKRRLLALEGTLSQLRS